MEGFRHTCKDRPSPPVSFRVPAALVPLQNLGQINLVLHECRVHGVSLARTGKAPKRSHFWDSEAVLRWCPVQESNLHGVNQWILSLTSWLSFAVFGRNR